VDPATGCVERALLDARSGAAAFGHKLDRNGASVLSVTGQSGMSLTLSDYPSVVTAYRTNYPTPRSATLIGFWAACCGSPRTAGRERLKQL
jgi:hypothetical protein